MSHNAALIAVATAMDTLADTLRSLAAPEAVVTAAPKAAKAKAPKAKAPKAEAVVSLPTVGTHPKGCCQGCGKAGMISNVFCGKCKAQAHKAGVVVPSRDTVQVAAVVTPAAPAKARTTANMGRRDAKAHCRAEGCGLFVKAGEKFCTKHTVTIATVTVSKAAKAAKPHAFITLDDGKRGFRVPADMVQTLRKAGVDDASIIKAAKAKGVGTKVAKAAGVL